jgi:membrane dipeptidase
MKIVDMHCDTISKILEERQDGKRTTLRKNLGHLDLERMKESGYLLQNFALFVDIKSCDDPWEQVMMLYHVYCEEMEQSNDLIAPVLKYEDIVNNESCGKMSALLTVEEGAVCKGDIQKLEKLYELGVRMLTITWNYPNELGYPGVENGAGLTKKGMEFVSRMEEMGMIPDVSHLSDQGFTDVLNCTKKPFVASHSNARAVCSHSRNLTDAMIRKLAERGGVMGLNFCADFVKTPVNNRQTADLNAFAAQTRHITNVGGIEVLGLGSDFDGIGTNEAIPGVQSMDKLMLALKAEGFTETEIEKIFFKNVLRLYKELM